MGKLVNYDLIFEILSCTNVIHDDVIIIEDCSKVNQELKGYSIVLDRDSIHDARMFFTAKYSKRASVIDASFTSGSDKEVIQIILSLEPDLTMKFIQRAGGVFNLISTGVDNEVSAVEEDTRGSVNPKESTDAIEPVGIVEEYNEEEDEELISELRDEIAELKKSLEEKNKALAQLEKDQVLLDTYPKDTSDLDDETIGFIFDKVDELDADSAKSIINSLISKSCDVEEREVCKILVSVADALSEVGCFE